MAWTQADIDAIDTLLKSGAKSVRYASGGSMREMQFSSTDELIKLRALATQEVNATSAQMPTRQFRVYTDKGF